MNRFSQDDLFTLSGALSFYSALAISPVAILMITVMGLLSLDMQTSLITETRGLLGADAAGVLETVVSQADSQPNLATISGWIGGIVLLISASVVFLQLHSSMNIIFDADKIEKPKQGTFATILGVVKDRLLSIGMLLSFVFLTIISLVLSSSLHFILESDILMLGVALSWIVNFAIFTLIFAAMFRWVSDRRPPFKYCMIGGAITAVLFTIGKMGIEVYIGQSAVGTPYGAAGSLIALLVWIYYASLIVFVGGEITATLFLPAREEVPAGERKSLSVKERREQRARQRGLRPQTQY